MTKLKPLGVGVIANWRSDGARPEIYTPGGEGPSSAGSLMSYGRQWRAIEP